MAKVKKVNYALIPEHKDPGPAMYELLEHVRMNGHEDIEAARIALAWCTSWKADVDGRLILGKCRRASDLDREFHRYDFVILLNAEWWQAAEVDNSQREALLDHELCHAAPKLDDAGDQVEDERGRKVWRTRKHDLEEFSEVVERRGLYKRDLELMAQAMTRSRQRSLLDMRDEIVKAGLVAETREFIARVRAGENGQDALDDIVRRIQGREPRPETEAETIARVAADPKVRKAVEALRPKPGGGLESVTISTPHDGRSVTLRKDGSTEVKGPAEPKEARH